MTPGPTIIRRCPNCSGLLKQRTIASGNTRRAKYWTDGEMIAPMLPQTPPLIRCPHCSSIAWMSDFPDVDSFEVDIGPLSLIDKDPELKATYEKEKRKRDQYKISPYYENPSAEEFLGFLDSTRLSSEEELHVRVLAWRAFNDARRKTDQPNPLSLQETRNLSRVVQMLSDQDQSTALLKAEGLRELGVLEEARRLIQDTVFEDKAEGRTAQFLLELIDARDTQVREIPKEAEDPSRTWRTVRAFLKQHPIDVSDICIDPKGPPEFGIRSRDWWFKVVGMLCHNWALIDAHEDQSATIYFFHDMGVTKGPVPKYEHGQLEGRCAIVDSLDFANIGEAQAALRRNGFDRLETNPGTWDLSEPIGIFFDARTSEEGIYSKSGYWT